MGTGGVNPLLRTSRFLRRNADTSSGGWSALTPGQRGAQSFYRDRWQRDKVVRSTHGVNCTGSCSWKVYVKDGIITWETHRPIIRRTGRTCPIRGARLSARCFVLLVYVLTAAHPLPLARGVLLEQYREAGYRHI